MQSSKHIVVYSDSARKSQTPLIRQIYTRWLEARGEGIRQGPVRGRRHLSEGRGIPQGEALGETNAPIRPRGREREEGREEGRKEEGGQGREGGGDSRGGKVRGEEKERRTRV